MTAEQLEELLEKVTPGEWRVAGKSSGYIVSDSESVVIAAVGDYRDDELLPFNRDRWDADCALFALAPTLAAEWLAQRRRIAELEAERDDCMVQLAIAVHQSRRVDND